jgi:hypothetical protein
MKPLYGAVADFDTTPFGAHTTKLAALRDPDPTYDLLRMALFLPEATAASSVARMLLQLTDAWRDGGEETFQQVGWHLLDFDKFEKQSQASPTNFERLSLETYFEALGTEGHSYYFSVTELLAIATAVGANVVVSQRREN